MPQHKGREIPKAGERSRDEKTSGEQEHLNWVLKDRWRLKEKWHSKPKRLARADRHQQVTGTQEQWAVMAEPEHRPGRSPPSGCHWLLG